MKIGVLVDRLDVGGVVKIAIEEVKALKSLGTDIKLLVMKRGKNEVIVDEWLADTGVIYLDDYIPRILRFSFKVPFFYFFSSFHITYPILLPFFLKRNICDIIISHNTHASLLAITISKIKKINYIAYIYDPIAYIINKAYKDSILMLVKPLLVWLANIADKLIVNIADAVLVQGDMHFKHIREIMRNKDNIFFLPPACGFKQNLPEKRGDYMVTATAWKEGKELERLINLMPHMNTRLKIVGTWIHKSYKEKILKLIKKLKIEELIDIVGAVSEEELNKIYEGARVVVITNNERGLGMAALEGASNGAPFVIPYECGISKYFENGKDGFFFNYGDDKMMGEHLLTLIKDERTAYRMGKSAWQKVKSQYSWEAHAKFLLKIIKRKQSV